MITAWFTTQFAARQRTTRTGPLVDATRLHHGLDSLEQAHVPNRIATHRDQVRTRTHREDARLAL